MAGETLRTAAELLDLFPDNVSGLIQAVDDRDFIVSVTTAVGFVEEDPTGLPFNIPIVNGVPVSILPLLTIPTFHGNFWKLDGNNELIPSYTDFGITVPPGDIRLVNGTVILYVQKAGGGTDSYTFQGTAGGIGVGYPQTVVLGTVPTVVILNGTRPYDVSLGEPIGVEVTGEGTSDDLSCSGIRVIVESMML